MDDILSQTVKIETIKDLREYLDEVESRWTDLDREYLGEFEDQPVKVPTFRVQEDKSFVFLGYDGPEVVHTMDCWFVFQRVE